MVYQNMILLIIFWKENEIHVYPTWVSASLPIMRMAVKYSCHDCYCTAFNSVPLPGCVFIFLLFRAVLFPSSAMNPICPLRNQPACYSVLLPFWCRKEGHLSLWVYPSSPARTKASWAASYKRWNRVESISFCFNAIETKQTFTGKC